MRANWLAIPKNLLEPCTAGLVIREAPVKLGDAYSLADAFFLHGNLLYFAYYSIGFSSKNQLLYCSDDFNA